MSKNKASLHDLRRAARDGDRRAIAALLTANGYHDLVAELVKRGDQPLTPRLRRRVLALTAGTDSEWEWRDEHGVLHNDLQDEPPTHTARG
jgi:hypothetical protein